MKPGFTEYLDAVILDFDSAVPIPVDTVANECIRSTLHLSPQVVEDGLHERDHRDHAQPYDDVEFYCHVVDPVVGWCRIYDTALS